MYVICATLFSGNDAHFVSNDALIKEKLRLNREEFHLFERWKQSRAISVRSADATIELSVSEI